MNIPKDLKSLTTEQLIQIINELLHINNEQAAQLEALNAELARRKKSQPSLR